MPGSTRRARPPRPTASIGWWCCTATCRTWRLTTCGRCWPRPPASASVAIAPDRLGTGTNGLALAPPGVIGFRFGTGSFAAHRAEAQAAGVEPAIVARPGLAFDLDTPEDLARWLELGSAA